MEEGKDPPTTTTVITRPNQPRALPQRLIQLLALFLILCFTISLFSIYMICKTGVVTTVTSAIPILQPCIQEQPPNNLDRWIMPPSNLIHTMSDKELFWRASFVPQVKKYPFGRVPKIAFMFLTKGPLPWLLCGKGFLRGIRVFIRYTIIRFHRMNRVFHPRLFFITDRYQVRYVAHLVSCYLKPFI